MNHGTASTYKYYGCRCDDCTVAASEYMRRMRAQNKALIKENGAIQNRVRSMCVQWMKHHHPELHIQFLNIAREELGYERKSGGRPRKDGAA